MHIDADTGLPRDAQRLILGLLGDLTGKSAGAVGRDFAPALARLGRYAEVDRCSIFECDARGGLAQTQGWTAPGAAPSALAPERLPAELFEPWRPQLAQGEPLHAPDVSAMPDAAPLKRALEKNGIRSLLVLPFTENGSWQGFLGFDMLRKPRAIPADAVRLLATAADLVWSTLARLRGEAQLRTANARMGALLQAMPELVFEIDAERRYTGIAAGPQDKMLASPEERAGKTITEILPPHVLPHFEAALAKADTGVVARTPRYRLDHKGARHWHEATFAPIEDGSGRGGALCLVRDVTEEEVSRQRLERLGKAAEMMTNHVIISDLDGRVLWANRAFCARSGYALDEIRGHPLVAFTRSPNTDPATAEAIAAAMQEGAAFTGEIVNRTRQGEDYWLHLTISRATELTMGEAVVIHVGTDITRLKAAEREAAAARELLEQATEALPDAFAYFDRDDRLVFCNNRYREFYPISAPVMQPGVAFADLIRYGAERGEYLDAIGREEDWIAHRLAEHASPGKPLDQALSSGRWIRVMEVPTPDGGRVGMRIDITELTHAKEKLANIITGAAVGTWEWDCIADRVEINARFAQMLGRDIEAFSNVPSQTLLEATHPEDRARVAAVMEAVYADETMIHEMEIRMLRPDGTPVWVEVRGRTLDWDGEGKPRRIAGVAIDISERKAAEEAMRRLNLQLTEAMAQHEAAVKRFSDIAAVSEDWFFELGPDLRHFYVSETFYAVVGTPADVKGEPLRALAAREAEGGGNWDALEAKLQKREPFSDFIFAGRGTDGQRIWLRIAGAPFHDRQTGAFLGYRGVGSNVTALYTERLRAMEASAAKGRLLATVSHEIRTPLNSILGMVELLEPDLDTPRQKEMLATISGSGDMLLGMLNNLLDMSKIEAGALDLVEAPISPMRVVEKTVRAYREQARSKGIDFDLLISPGADKPRLGDAHRLQQVVQNLVSNAFKFTSQGEVTVRVSARAGKPVVIDVSDTGIGMSENELRTIFDAYRQADSQIAERFGGTGLGLSIVRELTALMKGEVDVESAPGKGTRFRITLPLPEVAVQLGADGAGTDHAPAVDPRSVIRGRRFLLADDSPTNLAVLTGMLNEAGAEVTEARNGLEAVEAWSAEAARRGGTPFDLLLLDIAMPVMDGLTALAEIRAREAAAGVSSVPALAVTANIQKDQIVDYVTNGFDGVLAKPLKKAELQSVAASLLPRGEAPGDDAPAVPARVARRAATLRSALVADDDPISREILAEFLGTIDRFDITFAHDGKEALAQAFGKTFGVIILDRRMPGLAGDRVARALRTCNTPNRDTAIVLATGDAAVPRAGRADRAEPDLYLPKPIDLAVLTENIRALMGLE